MPEAKKLEALTGWLSYELQPTDLIDGTKVSFRLRYLDALDMTDAVSRNRMSPILGAREMALTAVAEWDLTAGGKPLPVTPETKESYLRPLLGASLVITDEDKRRAEAAGTETFGLSLAVAIARDSQKRSLFLKN